MRWYRFLATLLFLSGSTATQAAPFGFFDPRSMAMGGAGVATADSANAVHFNPALLAVYPQYKEASGNSRLVVPSLTGQWSDSARSLVDLQAEDYGNDLAATINAYNTAPSNNSAAGVANEASALSGALSEASSEPLFYDINAGLVVGIPSLLQGGAFFANGRAVASGEVIYSAEDQALLKKYTDGLTYIATDGAAGAPAPELFDAQGQLLDPTNDFSSTAQATGWLIAEAGVAVSDEVELFGRAVYWGVTPKVQGLSAIDEEENAVRGTVKVEHDSTYRFRLNFDAGVAVDLQPSLRVGIVLKDLFPNTLETRLGNTVTLDPQLRAGVAYRKGTTLLSADLDLLSNSSLANEPDYQHLAFGAEHAAQSWLRARAGYMHNLRDFSQLGLLTVGAGIAVWAIDLDVAYGIGQGSQSAALRLLVRF